VAAAHNPLEQFNIKSWIPIRIGDLDLSFTNSAAFMVLSVVLVAALMVFAVRRRALVPGRWQLMAELFYGFIANMVRDNVGREGRPYFPFVFTLFSFILFGNILGLLPYSFTFTSHIIVTVSLALLIFIGVTVIALVKHGFRFFAFFLPPGVPLLIAPLLVPIEIISYLSRPISLSVRLFANMMAGHTLLKVIAGFVFSLGVFGVVPVAGLVAITGLELLIAFLQAYIFSILTCLYLNDALHLH
jgi:F-type H+-transporting ATPase subunit a